MKRINWKEEKIENEEKQNVIQIRRKTDVQKVRDR